MRKSDPVPLLPRCARKDRRVMAALGQEAYGHLLELIELKRRRRPAERHTYSSLIRESIEDYWWLLIGQNQLKD